MTQQERSLTQSPDGSGVGEPTKIMKRHVPILFLALSLAACGPVEPRFGSVSVSATAPRATLSGHTSATGTPAIDLSAGCPGFVDTGTPEHLVRLDDASAITIAARSLRGPLAIAVVGPNDVRCDSDEGTGHAPHVTITQPGEYSVHVGALEAPADLPYELSLAPSAPGASEGTSVASSDHRVSVTVTTTPSGATVRTPEGETLGTTPAMFVLTVPESEMGHDRRFVLEMPGYATTEATGRLIGDAMVVHATLSSGGPAVATTATSAPTPAAATLTSGTFDASTSASASAAPVPIRDYRVATQTLEVTTECSIGAMSVDVDAQHAFSQDLRIVLHGPAGQTATLANHTGGSRSYAPRSYAWDDARGALHAFGDTSARGTWSLEVRDDAGEDEGVFRGFTLHFTCGGTAAVTASAPSAPPVTRTPSRPRPPLPVRPPPQTGVLDPWSSRPPPPPPPSTTLRRNPGPAPTINPF